MYSCLEITRAQHITYILCFPKKFNLKCFNLRILAFLTVEQDFLRGGEVIFLTKKGGAFLSSRILIIFLIPPPF